MGFWAALPAMAKAGIISGGIQAVGSIGAGLAGASGSSGVDEGRRAYEADRAWLTQIKAMQLRKEDAERSGFHPLAALGLSPGNYAIPNFQRDDSHARKANALARAGQNATSALSKAFLQRGLEFEKAKIENMAAQTDYITAQKKALEYDIMSRNASQFKVQYLPTPKNATDFNAMGQGPAGKSQVKVTDVQQSAKLQGGVAQGTPAMEQWKESFTQFGVGYHRGLSKDEAEILESSIIDQLTYYLDRGIRYVSPYAAGITGNAKGWLIRNQPPWPAGKGKEWKFNIIDQKFYAMKSYKKQTKKRHRVPAYQTRPSH